MEVKALGPYTFIEYLGKERLTATIADLKGRRKRCSVSNLLPIHTPGAPARQIRIGLNQSRVQNQMNQHKSISVTQILILISVSHPL